MIYRIPIAIVGMVLWCLAATAVSVSVAEQPASIAISMLLGMPAGIVAVPWMVFGNEMFRRD